MKLSRKKAAFILALLTLIAAPAAAETILIANHSFAVVTEPSRSQDGQCARAAVLLKNEDCRVSYTVSYGDATLGSGELDLSGGPQSIALGNARLRLGCQVQGSVRVTGL